MQSRDPAPAQCVGRRIAVEQMAIEKIRTKPPWQAEGEDPDRREPHPRVIVQIAGFHEFFDPRVEADKPRVPRLGSLHIEAQAAVSVERGEIGPQPLNIGFPDLRTLFQPALEVATPEHLLDEFFCSLRAMGGKCRRDDFLLADEPASDIGRQARHGFVLSRTVVMIAPVGVAPPHCRDEVLHRGQSCRAGGDEILHESAASSDL